MKPRRRERPRLTSGPIGRQLVRMGLPMVVGIASIGTFNLVDTWFVGRLGPAQLAAMGFTFPVVMLVGSVSLGLGVGTTSVLSRAIGAGQADRARRITSDSLVFALLLVGLLATIGALTIDPLFTLLGAGPDTLPLIREYMRVWYLGMVFLVVPMVGNAAIRATGDTRTPAMIMVFAGVVNAALDPVLIFGLGPIPALGFAGAAWATVIGRASTLAVSLWVLAVRDRMLAGNPTHLRAVWKSWVEVLRVGIPTAATNVAVPVTIAILTRMLAGYDDASVAAYAAGSRVLMLTMVPAIALNSGLAPFIGQNWGAQALDRVGRALVLAHRFVIGWGLLAWGILAVGGAVLAHAFTDDPATARQLTLFLAIGPAGVAGQGVFMTTSGSFNAIGRPARAAALAILRTPVVLVTLAVVGGGLWGVTGIYGALAITNTSVGVLAWWWSRALRRG